MTKSRAEEIIREFLIKRDNSRQEMFRHQAVGNKEEHESEYERYEQLRIKFEEDTKVYRVEPWFNQTVYRIASETVLADD